MSEDEVVGEVEEDEDLEVLDVDSDEEDEEDGEETKDVTEVAREVIHKKWGIGQERRKALSDAGYDPKEVEEEVTRLLNE